MATKKVNKKPDFSNGKIYMLYDNTNSAIYVGSTVKKLSYRLSEHKNHYKLWHDGNVNVRYNTSYDIIANGNCIIVWIEDFPCNSTAELQEREQYWIDYHEGCINKCRASNTEEDYKRQAQKYRAEHADELKEREKQYRTDHADELKEKNKIWRTDNVEVLKEKQKIFRTENADVIREQKRAFRVANDAKIKEHKNKKATCECGVEYSHANLARHLRSAQHTKLLTILKSPIIL